MKKFIILIILFLGIRSTAYCQNNNAIAKIRYQEAEELFDKGDFQMSLKKLNEVEKLLNSTNSKILYLKILIEDTLYRKVRQEIIPTFKMTNQIQRDVDYFIKNYYSVSEEKLAHISKIEEFYDTIPKNLEEYQIWFNHRINYWKLKKVEFENILAQQHRLSGDLEKEIKTIIKKRKGFLRRFCAVGIGLFSIIPIWAIAGDSDPLSWLPIGIVGGGGLMFSIISSSELSKNEYSRFYSDQQQMLKELEAAGMELKHYIESIDRIIQESKI